MAVELYPQGFDPLQRLADYQRDALTPGSFGACASFVGSMRDFNEGDDVSGMTLEHYPGMTEQQLESIIEEAREKWPLLDALICHRIGDIAPGEPIVLTACWSAHRAASFEACRFLMEALKSRATFWKKEQLSADEHRWVAKNTPG
jgi:molybdopterin synthase catalytic subunit